MRSSPRPWRAWSKVARRLFLVAAISAKDCHRARQECQRTHCLTWVDLWRGYGVLIVPRFVIVRLVDSCHLIVSAPIITASGEGEVCSERK